EPDERPSAALLLPAARLATRGALGLGAAPASGRLRNGLPLVGLAMGRRSAGALLRPRHARLPRISPVDGPRDLGAARLRADAVDDRGGALGARGGPRDGLRAPDLAVHGALRAGARVPLLGVPLSRGGLRLRGGASRFRAPEEGAAAPLGRRPGAPRGPGRLLLRHPRLAPARQRSGGGGPGHLAPGELSPRRAGRRRLPREPHAVALPVLLL